MTQCWQVHPTVWILCQTLTPLAVLDKLIFFTNSFKCCHLLCDSILSCNCFNSLSCCCSAQRHTHFNKDYIQDFSGTSFIFIFLCYSGCFSVNAPCQLLKLCIPLRVLHFTHTGAVSQFSQHLHISSGSSCGANTFKERIFNIYLFLFFFTLT